MKTTKLQLTNMPEINKRGNDLNEPNNDKKKRENVQRKP